MLFRSAGNSINFVKNGPGQVTMGRLPLSVSTTFTNASTTLTVGSTTGLAVGMYVVGTGIAPSTRITAITSGTSITVGTATTAAGTSTSLQYSDNTYTGTTTVNQGVLSFSNFLQLGAFGDPSDEFKVFTGVDTPPGGSGYAIGDPKPRNLVGRTLADADGDGWTDSFWFVSPSSSDRKIGRAHV